MPRLDTTTRVCVRLLPVSPLIPTRRRICVIYNPTAGGRRRRRFESVLALLAAEGCAVTLLETGARGDAEDFARGIDEAAFDAVAAAGGDGTINEIINGLGPKNLPLALVPLGTANVLAAEIGLAANPRAIVESIVRGEVLPVYLGIINARRFAMMAGIGFDARVVAHVDLRLKRALGKGAYVLSTLALLPRARPTAYRVEIDGARFAAAGIVIANGRYYGGRFVVAAEARLAARQLHVALFGRGARRDVLRYGAALLTGRIATLADVQILTGTSVRIDGPEGERVQVDGDIAAALPLVVSVCERPIALLR